MTPHHSPTAKMVLIPIVKISKLPPATKQTRAHLWIKPLRGRSNNINNNNFFLQVFLLTVVFGLFHGLVFLPVILGLVGTMPKEAAAGGREDKESSSSSSVDSDVDRESATTPASATTDSGVASSSAAAENNNKKSHSNNGKTLLGLSNEGYVFDEVCFWVHRLFTSCSLLHEITAPKNWIWNMSHFSLHPHSHSFTHFKFATKHQTWKEEEDRWKNGRKKEKHHFVGRKKEKGEFFTLPLFSGLLHDLCLVNPRKISFQFLGNSLSYSYFFFPPRCSFIPGRFQP